MRIAAIIDDVITRLYESTFELNSRLSNRVSVAKFDVDGEEHWATSGLSCAPVIALGGFIQPQLKQEVKISRGIAPFENCASGRFVALGGKAEWINHFFGGYIAKIEHDLVGIRNIYHCVAYDYNSFLHSKLVDKVYDNKTELQIIGDLFAIYWSDIDVGTYVESGEEGVTIEFPRIFLDEALEQLAEIHGREWYIDYEKKLHYFTPNITDAPFELSDSVISGLTTKIPYSNFHYEGDATRLVNRITVVGLDDDGNLIVVTRQSDASYARYQQWYDDKIVDKNINTEEWAQLVGDAVLAEKAFEKEFGRCTINQEGLIVGQKVKITNARRVISGHYLIQQLRLKLKGGLTEEVALEFGDYRQGLLDLLEDINKLKRIEPEGVEPGDVPTGLLEQWYEVAIGLMHNETKVNVNIAHNENISITSEHKQACTDAPADMIKRVTPAITLVDAETIVSVDESHNKNIAIAAGGGAQLLVGGAVADDGGAQTDETSEARNATVNDMTLLPACTNGGLVVGDTYYWGFARTWNRLWQNIGIPAIGNYALEHVYWDGDSWELLPDFVDETGEFAIAGLNKMTWTIPGDWAQTTIQGMNLYWVGVRVTAVVTYTQQPKGTQAWCEVLA